MIAPNVGHFDANYTEAIQRRVKLNTNYLSQSHITDNFDEINSD